MRKDYTREREFRYSLCSNFNFVMGMLRKIIGEQLRLSLQRLLLGDQIIQESHIATCQQLFFTKGAGTGRETVKAGFLASHDGVKFICREQQLVELLPATGKYKACIN